jgi:hypothetical protein
VSLKVPLYTPLYCPDHTPVRLTAAGGAVGVAAAVGALVGTGVLVARALVGAGVGVPVVDDALQAASSDPRPIAVNITMVRFISELLPYLQFYASYCYTWLILLEVTTIDSLRRRYLAR